MWGSVGCRRWEKSVPSCHSPTKPLKMMTASICTQCHVLKAILFERRVANSCCFSKLHLRLMMPRWLSPCWRSSRLTPACLWAVKDFSFPTMKSTSYNSREALLLISWSGKNGQSPSKSDYKARIWKYSECPSVCPPRLGNVLYLSVMLWKDAHKQGGN